MFLGEGGSRLLGSREGSGCALVGFAGSCTVQVPGALVGVVGRYLGLGGGGEDCPLVVAQDLQPALHIGGVIRPGLRGEGQVGAEEGRAQLGNQLLGCICLLAESAFQIPCASAGVPGPMRHFMGERGVVADRVGEGREGRHLDAVLDRAVEGPVSAVLDGSAKSGKERLGTLDPLRLG